MSLSLATWNANGIWAWESKGCCDPVPAVKVDLRNLTRSVPGLVLQVIE